MGLLTPKQFYVTDRGDTHQLDEMQVSHLMNALNHHRKQLDVLDWIIAEFHSCASVNLGNVHRRRMDLCATIDALTQELISRDPDKDPDPTRPDY